jgi:protein involved in polysaccharide export with SLBB domain
MGFPLLIGRLSLLLWLFVALGTSVSAQNANPYRLGPQDKLRVKIGEWRADQAEMHDWKNLSGENTVDPSGNLLLPLLGEVQAAGMSVGELADDISSRLQKRIGLVKRPDTTIEVIQFRPFYIVGDVQHPGEYPFRPGMNVLQAISIAGGMYRTTDASLLRFQREAIASRGDLRVLGGERVALLARRARLQAELDDVDTLNLPPELTQDQSPVTQQVLREELLILQARRKQLREQVDSLVQTKTMLEREVETSQQKSSVLDRQIRLVRKELESITALLNKGLSYNSRQLTLEQDVARFESLQVDVELSISKTRQDISRAERSILELGSKMRNDVLSEIRQVETRLAENAERSATALKLTYDSEISAPRELVDQRGDEQSAPLLTIVRKADEAQPRSIRSGETDPVQPGDIVKVERRAPPSKNTAQSDAPENATRYSSANSER